MTSAIAHEQSQPPAKPFMWAEALYMTRRSVAAAGLTAAAIALMIASAILFAPMERYLNPPLTEATIAALLGGVALFFAMRLSTHKVEAQPVTDHAMVGGRAQWFLVLPGLALLAFGTEISANVLKTETLPMLNPDVQFAALLLGLILFTLGMIGVRRFSIPRIHLRDVLPIGAILMLAFFIRSYQLDTLVRLTVDEGHFMNGVSSLYQIEGRSPTDLLTSVNGNLPATMIYSYFNYTAAMLYGRNLVGLRMANAIIGTLTVLAAYGAGHAFFNRRVAIVGALIMATFPAHVFCSRVSMGQVSDALFATLAIMFAARGYRFNRRSDWVLMGINLGLSQYFYEGGRLLFPPMFVCWIILLALVLRGRFKWLRRGLFLAVFTSIIVITPMYFTMWYTHAPFTGRLNSSGMDMSIFTRALRGELDEAESQYLYLHVTDPFLVYTFNYHHSMLDIYGGYEPLVLRFCVPLFLLGIFHVLWRLRSASTLLLIAVFGTSFGSIFVADALIYPRYASIMPMLALLVGIGLACTLPMLNPFVRRLHFDQPPQFLTESRSWINRRIVPVYALALFFAAVQLYYFTNHLMPEFNYSARAAAASGDIFDAGLRFLERPNAKHEQMLIYDKGYGVANTVNELIAFAISPTDYYADMHLSTDITLETLDALPRDRTYAFFVLPSDERMIDLLKQSFTVEPPTYSPYPAPLMRSLYLMFVAPLEQNTQPRHMQEAAERAGMLTQNRSN
jgi:hypothetical protein